VNKVEKAIKYFEGLLDRLGNGKTDNIVCTIALEALREKRDFVATHDKYKNELEQMRSALKEAIFSIETGRLCSIGSHNNTYVSQISVSSVEGWKEIFDKSEAGIK
jgi:Ni2+-binding GTPase involved in maturation of urease and hydrogenase